jgi:RNA polymerase sigma-70 factor (ECF subfamily)
MDSIEQLFKQYYPFVCNVINAYVRDRTVTEDIAQELFTELWVKRDQLNIHTSVPAYLRRMAVSRSLNHIRDSKKHNWDELDATTEMAPGLSGASASVIQQMEEAELKKSIDVAIGMLPEKCRIVFLLSRQEEMSYAEIADHMHISIKTVENQIGKALKLLRIAVADHRGISK